MCDFPVDVSSKAKKSKPVYQNIPTWDSSRSEKSGSECTITTGSKRKRRALPKNASSALWRQERLKPGEYNVYNPPTQCYWAALLKLYDDTTLNGILNNRCYNCTRCRPNYFNLTQLPETSYERNELPDVVNFVRAKLNTLAIQLGSSITSTLHLTCMRNIAIADRVLTEDYRKRFSQYYYRVARGDLMGWIWTAKHGQEVVKVVCDAVGLPMPRHILDQSKEIFFDDTQHSIVDPTFQTRHPFDISSDSQLSFTFLTKTSLEEPGTEDKRIVIDKEPEHRTARGALCQPRRQQK